MAAPVVDLVYGVLNLVAVAAVAGDEGSGPIAALMIPTAVISGLGHSTSAVVGHGRVTRCRDARAKYHSAIAAAATTTR